MSANTLLISQQLRSQLRGLQCLSLEQPRQVLPVGVGSLDELLPDGGLPVGSFIEIISDVEGAGAYSLALRLGRRLLERRPAWAVVDTEGTFYPPAAESAGFDSRRLVLLRPRADDDAWAYTQVLRSPDISVSFWSTARMDNMVFRRLQLAAERGGGMGFVLRPLSAERKPSWAGLRLKAAWSRADGTPRLRVSLLHAPGRFANANQFVEIGEFP